VMGGAAALHPHPSEACDSWLPHTTTSTPCSQEWTCVVESPSQTPHTGRRKNTNSFPATRHASDGPEEVKKPHLACSSADGVRHTEDPPKGRAQLPPQSRASNGLTNLRPLADRKRPTLPAFSSRFAPSASGSLRHFCLPTTTPRISGIHDLTPKACAHRILREHGCGASLNATASSPLATPPPYILFFSPPGRTWVYKPAPDRRHTPLGRLVSCLATALLPIYTTPPPTTPQHRRSGVRRRAGRRVLRQDERRLRAPELHRS
jgi:hypothetical protein